MEIQELYKFPRTSHILDVGGNISRDDLILDPKEAEIYFNSDIVIEEKVDGANLGISITENYEILFQNRSHFVNSSTSSQWKNLDEWVKNHPGIWDILTPDIILFGEWCFAKHSIHYTKLPDYFLSFDIYDKKEKKFYSRKRRDKLLEGTGIESINLLGRGRYSADELKELLETKSMYYDGKIEGIYIRIEDENFVLSRGKIVRSDFIQQIDTHWSKQKLTKNIIQKTYY